MPTISRRIINYTNRVVTSPLSRYGALILLVAVIFALYFTINHQVSKPYGTGPSIISEHVIINSTLHPFNSTTYSPGAPSGDLPAWDDESNINGQDTYDPSKGDVKQIGNSTSQIQGLLYDRGDGCSSITNNYTDYVTLYTTNTSGVIPQIPLPAYYRKYMIGFISANTSRCSISEKISNSVSDNDIGIIFWTPDDQDLPDLNLTAIPVFSINLNSSLVFESELSFLYDQFKNHSSVYRVLRVEMIPFQPISPNFWLVSMVSVAGVLVLSFFVSIILHVRINRGRRRRLEQVRMQRSRDESLGMKKWTLDKEVVGKFPVIIYSRKIAPIETEEKRSSKSATLTNKNEGKEDYVDEGDFDEQPRHQLRRKASTRSTKSQRSERAVGNAAVLYSSPNADTTTSLDHISNSETRETCAICLEDFDNGDEIRELPCRHWYHVECIDPWLTTKSSSCPLCKKDCKPDNVEGITEQNTVVVSAQEAQERESQAPQVVDSQNRTSSPSSSTSSSTGRGVMVHVMNKLFRPRQRSQGQQEVADERGGEETYSEMEDVRTSGNV